MKFIGAHVSISGGLFNAPANACEIGATAFAMFTKNQRQWQTRPLTEENVSSFKEALHSCGYTPEQVLPHDGYLINLANPDDEKRKKSLDAFIDECRRCEALGLTGLNLHPGSALDGGETEGLKRIADCLKEALEETSSVRLILENTAGQGSALGHRFEHLGELIGMTGQEARMGVCIDTCHAWAAGYDLKEDFDGVWTEFDRLVGFRLLKGMHLNDAKKPLASRVDRHAPLGDGTIGWEVFDRIAADPRFDGIPLILETPEPERWSDEIQRLSLSSAGN